MKKEDINQLLKESRTTTSDHFTDKLMEKIELEPKVVQVPLWYKLLFGLGTAGLMGTSFFLVELKGTRFPVSSVDLPPFFFQGTAILFAIWALNFYLRLTENLDQSK